MPKARARGPGRGAGAGAQGHAARRGAGPLQGRWLGPGALCGLGRDPSISEESVHVGSWRTRPADPDPPAGPGPRSLPPPHPQLPDAAACNLDAEFPVGPVVLYCRLPQCFSSNFWVMSAQARCTRVRAGSLGRRLSPHATPHHARRSQALSIDALYSQSPAQEAAGKAERRCPLPTRPAREHSPLLSRASGRKGRKSRRRRLPLTCSSARAASPSP